MEGGEGGEGGWDMEDLDIPADVAAEAAAAAAGGTAEAAGEFAPPAPGVSAVARWQTKCSLAAEQVAAGAFDTAMRLLTRCAGCVRRGCLLRGPWRPAERLGALSKGTRLQPLRPARALGSTSQRLLPCPPCSLTPLTLCPLPSTPTHPPHASAGKRASSILSR